MAAPYKALTFDIDSFAGFGKNEQGLKSILENLQLTKKQKSILKDKFFDRRETYYNSSTFL